MGKVLLEVRDRPTKRIVYVPNFEKDLIDDQGEWK